MFLYSPIEQFLLFPISYFSFSNMSFFYSLIIIICVLVLNYSYIINNIKNIYI